MVKRVVHHTYASEQYEKSINILMFNIRLMAKMDSIKQICLDLKLSCKKQDRHLLDGSNDITVIAVSHVN